VVPGHPLRGARGQYLLWAALSAAGRATV